MTRDAVPTDTVLEAVASVPGDVEQDIAEAVAFMGPERSVGEPGSEGHRGQALGVRRIHPQVSFTWGPVLPEPRVLGAQLQATNSVARASVSLEMWMLEPKLHS